MRLTVNQKRQLRVIRHALKQYRVPLSIRHKILAVIFESLEEKRELSK